MRFEISSCSKQLLTLSFTDLTSNTSFLKSRNRPMFDVKIHCINFWMFHLNLHQVSEEPRYFGMSTFTTCISHTQGHLDLFQELLGQPGRGWMIWSLLIPETPPGARCLPAKDLPNYCPKLCCSLHTLFPLGEGFCLHDVSVTTMWMMPKCPLSFCFSSKY